MAVFERYLLFEGPIFNFHDYGRNRNSIPFVICPLPYHTHLTFHIKTLMPRSMVEWHPPRLARRLATKAVNKAPNFSAEEMSSDQNPC